MAIMEGIIAKAITEIVKQAAKAGWKTISRQERVLKVLNNIGLKPETPEPDFKSIYAHTLVEYGIDKPEPLLNFFRHEDIRKAFKKSFDDADFAVLHNEAAHLIKWNKIGDELRDQDIDPRTEFASFRLVFNELVNSSRNPIETRQENKLDKIIKLIESGNLEEIRAKSVEMIQGNHLEQLKAWFKTLEYSFGDYTRQTDEYSEWIIKIPARRGFDSILVRFTERQVEVEDIIGIKKAVKQHQTDEGWLIAAYRKSQSAIDMAKEEDTVFCYTFDELIDEHADFSRYFDWLGEFIRERKMHKDYIPLACKRGLLDKSTKERVDDEYYGEGEGWTEGYINRWLQDPCKEHISILGEFGTGKTWFTHHYAWDVMQEYKEAKEKGLKRPRVPLVIQLRDYSKALNSKSLFSDFFFRKHEIPLPGYSAFEQLNRMGRLLLIFDGFDEMADKLDRQKMINNFWELARIVVPGTKVILTCRTEHFPNAREGRDLLNAELKASTSNLTGDPPQFEILELARFDEKQIRLALTKRTNTKTVELIMGHTELLDLASRPVMLDFILEALPEIEAGKPIDLSRIYLYAIKSKLDKDIKSERTFTSMADKVFFMCELAWEMITTDKMSLNYRLFPGMLKNLFGPVVSEEKDLDHWNYDMMGNTLLTRNDDGDYYPAHRSLLEFFTAFKAVAELGLLPADFTELVKSQSNADDNLKPKDYTWRLYFHREIDGNGDIQCIPPLRRFLSDNMAGVLNSLGKMGDAVFRFIHEITNIEEVRGHFHKIISDYIEKFKQGERSLDENQDMLVFLLKFRVMTQEWEAEEGKRDVIRSFWKRHLEREINSEKRIINNETFSINSYAGSSIEFDMAIIPEGSFLMGDEYYGPVHMVNISRLFSIATVPVNQKLYSAVMAKNPSEFKGEDLPVETVSWLDAVLFCNKLSKMLNMEPAYNIEGENVSWDQKSTGFRLPTEAEWEYACRAGSTSAFSSGDLESDLMTVGWFSGNTGKGTKPVGKKMPNPWGLYDMHGNIWEWVWDYYGAYTKEPVTAPMNFSKGGSNRVVRGGGWSDDARDCRSAIRGYGPPGGRSRFIGFRLSRSVTLGT